MTITAHEEGWSVVIGATRVEALTRSGRRRSSPTAAPPAAIAPVVPGERIEASDHPDEAHVDHAGSGLDWPPYARVDAESGSARFPAAYAWTLLHREGSARTESDGSAAWVWKRASRQVSIRASEAIAAITRAYAPRDLAADAPTLLVVPNTIDLFQQDRLISELRRRRLQPILLWRPIAGALQWIEEHGRELSFSGVEPMIPFGRLLFIHAGLEAFEADVIDLVRYPHNGADLVLPARRRQSIPSYFDWAMKVTENAERDQGFMSAWRRFWWRLDQPSEGDPKGGAGTASVELTEWREARGISGKLLAKKIAFDTGGQSLRDWFACAIGEQNKAVPIVGMVLTGSNAHSVRSLGLDNALRDKAVNADRVRWMTEAAEEPCRALAQGADLFLKRHLANEPTYLDMLPSVRTVAVSKGEPVWAELVADSDKLVMGARAQTYEPDIPTFDIQRDEESVKLSVALEGEQYVRETEVDLGVPPAEKVRVGLRLEIAAGQGNPIVEFKGREKGHALSRRVLLDWDCAPQTTLTPEQCLENEPRAFPPTDPRQASYECWLGVSGMYGVQSTRAAMLEAHHSIGHKNSGLLPSRLERLRECLRDNEKGIKDNEGKPIHATAFGSDGRPNPRVDENDVIDEFTDHAVERLLSTRPTSQSALSLRQDLLRCLGYMSCDLQEFLEYLSGRMSELRSTLDGFELDAYLVACGHCLRDPAHIASFAKAMDERIASEPEIPPNRWLKALCQLLRYREDATELMDSALCARLTWFSYKVAQKQVTHQGSAAFKYRYGVLSVAHLLRRRRHDDGFLDPESPEAETIKAFMEATRKKLLRGTLRGTGGVVDPAKATKQIVDYIDRRGRGRLVLTDKD